MRRGTMARGGLGLVAAVLLASALGADDPRGRAIERFLAAAAEKLKPLPLVPIPDDPPPHEGALSEIPYVIEAPDFLMVEALEGLPGRPISGERLVRPDGTINLGFYGEVYVRGLTRDQAKAKIILHLRNYISDDALGLLKTRASVLDPEEPSAPPSDIPPLPYEEGPMRPGSGEAKGAEPEASEPASPDAPSASTRRFPQGTPGRIDRRQTPAPARFAPPVHPRRSSANRVTRRTPIRRVSQAPDSLPPTPDGIAPTPSAMIQLPPGGSVKITIEVLGQPGLPALPIDGVPAAPSGAGRTDGLNDDESLVEPADSDRVFVDLVAYNSKYYYIQGDVGLPGRYTVTGNETVLDAMTYAGGFLPTAEPKDIRLVRPARGGKPEKVYPIDWDSIVNKGDKRANLQLFPGDRIIIGRNKIVEKTVELNRLAEPTSLLENEILRNTQMLRYLSQTADALAPSSTFRAGLDLGGFHFSLEGGGGHALTPAQREAILGEWVDLWWDATPTGSLAIDKDTFRKAMIRRLSPPPADKPRDDARPDW